MKEVLTPAETLLAATSAGRAKVALQRRPWRMLLMTLLAGAYIALGGILSVTAGFGLPEASAGNPALQRLISGATFPVGLILVVVLGAELFTGNNALLIPGADEESAADYVAEGGRNEVGGEHLADGHFGPFEHSGGDEKHIGYAVFIAEHHKGHYRKPASEHLAGHGAA